MEREEWIEEEETPPYRPYSLYSSLLVKIKQAMSCGRKTSPSVHIVMSFDFLQFTGGLKTVGSLYKTVQGVEHFKIKHYRDLSPFLGSNWHFRGLNASGDYGYVVMETVDFCLRKSRSLVEYLPPRNQLPPPKSFLDTGYVFAFSFVCDYGTQCTFGKDKNIFYE